GPNACASFRCADRGRSTRWPTPFCSWLPMNRPTSQVRKYTWTGEVSPYRDARGATSFLVPNRRLTSRRNGTFLVFAPAKCGDAEPAGEKYAARVEIDRTPEFIEWRVDRGVVPRRRTVGNYSGAPGRPNLSTVARSAACMSA